MVQFARTGHVTVEGPLRLKEANPQAGGVPGRGHR
jgi:hypothetical protein